MNLKKNNSILERNLVLNDVFTGGWRSGKGILKAIKEGGLKSGIGALNLERSLEFMTLGFDINKGVTDLQKQDSKKQFDAVPVFEKNSKAFIPYRLPENESNKKTISNNPNSQNTKPNKSVSPKISMDSKCTKP